MYYILVEYWIYYLHTNLSPSHNYWQLFFPYKFDLYLTTRYVANSVTFYCLLCKDRKKKTMSQDLPIVLTSYGPVRGRKRTSVNQVDFYSFQGIPYAKPPIGELRFKVCWKMSKILLLPILHSVSIAV